MIAAFDEEGHVGRRTLDLDGRPRSTTDPNGNTVRFEYYDSTRDGRLKLQGDAVGRVTQFDYDANGNVTVRTDNLGRTTLTSYDEQNRAVRAAGPAYTDATLGTVRPVTRYAYSLLGDLVSVAAGTTDATGTNPASDSVAVQMTYAWDDFGRKIAETDGLGRTRRWTYDAQGNPLTATDAKLQTTRFTWSYGHLLATRRDHAGALTTWIRNPRGQPTQVSSPGTTYVMTYDAANRVATVRDTRGVTLTYRWSPGGRLTSYEDTQANRTDYAYDAVGRLNGIWSPKGDLVSLIYDAGGRLTDKWFPNGVATQYAWNADNTLSRVVNSYQSRVLLSQHDYTYDAVGNRATYFEALAPGTINSYTYVYDPLNRLTDVRDTVTTAALERYTYDALGNRSTKTEFGGAVTAYLYDAANQLIEWRSVAAGHLLGAQVFDANGNVTKKCEAGTVIVTATDCTGSAITTLTYNALNELSQAAKTGLGTQVYAYDDEGRRVRKTVGGVATNYLYMASDIVSQYGSSMAVPPTAVFTHGPNVDDPLIRAAGTTNQYYHQDGLGSVTVLSNADGGAVASTRHDAFGVKIDPFGTIPIYGYTGREPDETGLIFYRARYYDPALGRFTQHDPIGLAGGLNLYAYVGNNPVNFTDPTGLIAAPTGAAFGGGGIGGGKGASSSGADSTFFNPGTTATAGSQKLESGVQVAAGPLLPLLGLGLLATDAAMGDGPIGSGVVKAGAGVAKAGAKVADDVLDAAKRLSDSALVARGGNAANQTAEKINAAIGPSRTPGVEGFSAQCNGGTCLSELGKFLRNEKLGVTTVGEIRAIGGDVIPTPGFGHHVTVTGASGEAVSPLLRIVPNPNPLVGP